MGDDHRKPPDHPDPNYEPTLNILDDADPLLGDNTSVIFHPTVASAKKPEPPAAEPAWVLDLMAKMDADMARQQATWDALRKKPPPPSAHRSWSWWIGGTLAGLLLVAGYWWFRPAPSVPPLPVATHRPMQPPVRSMPPSHLPPTPVQPTPKPLPVPVVVVPTPAPPAPTVAPALQPAATPFIGAVVSDMPAVAAYYHQEDPGLVVTAVYPESPAAVSGVREGDLLIAMNYQPLRAASDLRLDALRVDDEVLLEIQRPNSRRAEQVRVRVAPTPAATADLNGLLEWYASRIAVDPENPLNYYFRATTYSANCTQITGPNRPEWCTPSADAAYLRDAYETVRRMPSWTEAQAEYAQAQLLVKGHVTTER